MGAVSVFAVDAVSLFVSAFDSDEPPPTPDDTLALGDEYASAYQPPPFKMNVPPLICRFADDLPHLGHTSTGASEIFWISSHAFLHSEHTYS